MVPRTHSSRVCSAIGPYPQVERLKQGSSPLWSGKDSKEWRGKRQRSCCGPSWRYYRGRASVAMRGSQTFEKKNPCDCRDRDGLPSMSRVPSSIPSPWSVFRESKPLTSLNAEPKSCFPTLTIWEDNNKVLGFYSTVEGGSIMIMIKQMSLWSDEASSGCMPKWNRRI